ncbi:MAG TPA: JAB domain-containing protein [Armatimonadetes bacterium]|nr:JAB domain-containing protein [Armatimonadota bacterium]
MGKLDYHLTIKDLPEDLRPRERLLREGAEKLSDAELLAIVLRVGNEEETAVQLAERVLTEAGGLRYLSDRTPEELGAIKGIGPAKIAQIKGALELGRRLAALTPEVRPRITSPQDAANLMMPRMRFLDKEHFIALLLNTKNEVIGEVTVSVGTLDMSVAHPREIFRAAIRRSSAGIVLLHNHPSGDPQPSSEDVQLTKQLVQAGNLLGIEVVDHLVIGDGRYVSLREKGLL